MIDIAGKGRPKGSKSKTFNTKLLPKQKALADLYISNKHTLAQCYELAGYACTNWTSMNKSARAKAVLDMKVVKEYIASIEKATQEKTMITREFVLDQYLQVITENSAIEKAGATSKLKALEQASKMLGYDKPDETIKKEDNKYFELPARAIGKAFSDINRDIDNNKYKEYNFEGGRGSLKSSYVSLKFIEKIEQNPTMCGIAIRQYTNTIGDSVFAQLIWAIEYLGLQDDYKWIKSPYEITKKSTGQKIYFRGADDATKLKSIKPPLGMYLAIHWIEEFDQIKGGMSAVRVMEQSLVRGGDVFYRFKSYNTPQSNTHFVNVEKVLPKEGRIVHKSNYLEAPIEWLGSAFIDEAEYLKEVNPTAYANEYMGEITGTGGMVFTNLDIRPITEEEYKGFNQEYQGLDFGFYPDPNHWSSCYYNAAKRTLYIADEWRSNKMSNKEIYNTLVYGTNLLDYAENGAIKNKPTGRIKDYVHILADSAEPKDIQDLHDYGMFISGAKKPPNSVKYGIKWLANLTQIVIDSNKCPETAKEFSQYELEKDKDDNYISVFPDKDNHSIDSIRYAISQISLRRGM